MSMKIGSSWRRGAAKARGLVLRRPSIPPKGAILIAQPTRVDENGSDQALSGDLQRIGPHPADVAGVAQADGRHSLGAGLFDGQAGGEIGPDLSQGSVGVHHGRAGMIADNPGSGPGLEATVSQGAKIFRVTHHSMGGVAEEIRLHDVVDHGAAVIFSAAGRLKEPVSDLAEILWVECGHGLGLRA